MSARPKLRAQPKYLPSEQKRRIRVNSSQSGPHHHTVPVRERALGDMCKNQLADLVREASITKCNEHGSLHRAQCLVETSAYQAPQYAMNGNILTECTISTPAPPSQETRSPIWAKNGRRPSKGVKRGNFCFRRATITLMYLYVVDEDKTTGQTIKLYFLRVRMTHALAMLPSNPTAPNHMNASRMDRSLNHPTVDIELYSFAPN